MYIAAGIKLMNRNYFLQVIKRSTLISNIQPKQDMHDKSYFKTLKPKHI